MPLKLQGIFPALTAPFDHEGALYRTKVFHNVSRLNQVALSGYLVGGSTGETPLLTTDERFQLMEWVKEANTEGRILVAGVGAESVHETVLLANRAADLGYHAALALTPHYFRNQMYQPATQALYYRSVADRSKLPVLIYNIPAVTGYDLPAETIAELSHHPNIVGMKDSSGNLEKMEHVLKQVKPGFQILSGSGANFWQALQLGSNGAILAIANALPYACVTIWEAFRTRQPEAGQDWQQRIFGAAQLINAKYGIAGLKYAMDLNGYYGGPPRLPLTPISIEGKQDVEKVFEGLRS